MSDNTLERIGHELEVVGYSLTSYDEIQADFNTAAVTELCERVTRSEGSAKALEVVEHIEKNDMTIVQDEICMELGRHILLPAIKALFASHPEVLESWSLFGINRYAYGGKFGPHRDDVGATVIVATMAGYRDFSLYKTNPDTPITGFDPEVEQTFRLGPGSLMILDAKKDPGHAVVDTPEASIVAVADIPEAHLIRATK
ncbi:hypothetical protein KA047_00315 [Candidatus Saccharibacteria bacterium]|nr:hypothetical protein [Candidatus Saccharibacteria bacterium]